ncbi:MFS transporter [Bacillus shivajii]|uniref:MFS transporter n=1 Tax=Bacillus shivajii TaxID=1983719 RepID=UPI001CFA19E5|nr:MFS transporter [Bacillus shivajii]UCZ51552.1 MFS transporter [Bacillus shivajii]
MSYFIYAIIVVVFLDTFIQLPIIAPLAVELGAPPFLTGLIVGIYSLANMVGNALSGPWIDKHGRKKVLLTGIAFVSITIMFYPFVNSGESLFFVRLLHGLAGGLLIPASFAYLGDRAPEQKKGKTMALSGACIGTSAIIGPALGGAIASTLSIQAVFYFVAGIFIVTGVTASFILKESYTAPCKDSQTVRKFDGVITLIKQPMLILAMIGAFSLMTSMGTLAYSLPLKIDALGLNPAITGMLLSSFGVVALIIFLTPINKIFDRTDSLVLMIVGLCLISVSLISLSQFNHLIFIFIILAVYGIGFAFIFPSMNRLVLDASTKKDRGKAFGLFYAAFSLGVVFGSVLSGATAISVITPFLINGVLLLFFTMIIYLLKRRIDLRLKMS